MHMMPVGQPGQPGHRPTRPGKAQRWRGRPQMTHEVNEVLVVRSPGYAGIFLDG